MGNTQSSIINETIDRLKKGNYTLDQISSVFDYIDSPEKVCNIINQTRFYNPKIKMSNKMKSKCFEKYGWNFISALKNQPDFINEFAIYYLDVLNSSEILDFTIQIIQYPQLSIELFCNKLKNIHFFAYNIISLKNNLNH